MPKAAQGFPEADSLAGDRGVNLTVCQCSACGLVQLSNDPVPYFREVIRASAGSPVLMEAKRKQFAGLIEKYGLGGKKLLEIGCGRGEFLALLDPATIKGYGVEFSDAAVAQCAGRGLHVSKAYLDDPAAVLPDGPFDAFLLLMFLEHMPAPNAALGAIHNNLAPAAVGLVEVPNFDMVLRKKLFSEFIGDHLLYFTQDTLRTTLHLNGFEILECGELRDEYVLSVVVRKREPLDIACFHEYQAKICADIQGYLARFAEKKVAIWGAGHQALTMIAISGIAGQIRYVVDAAPFKQGKFTPVSHLPIVPPDKLRQDPVDAVIVMAAAYSDEVAGILREKFPPELNVAILRDFGLEVAARPRP